MDVDFKKLFDCSDGTCANGTWLSSPSSNHLSEEYAFQLACTAVYSILAVAAVLGNSLFCVVIWRSTKLRSVTNMLMGNLGIANLFLLLFHPPVFIVSYILQADWHLGSILCKMCSSITYVTVTASFWFMAIVAIDRWLVIFCRHLRLTKLTASLLTAAAWILSCLVASPYVYFYVLDPRPKHFHRLLEAFVLNQTSSSVAMTARCINSCIEEGCRKPLLFATVGVQFVLPLLVMTPVYSHLALHLLRRPTLIGANSPARRRRARRHKRRSLLTLLAVVASLLLCWAPLNLVAVAHSLGQLSRVVRDPLAALILANMLATLSVCLTPILYMMNDAYRSEVMRLVRCLQASHTPSSTSMSPSTVQASQHGRRVNSSPAIVQHFVTRASPLAAPTGPLSQIRRRRRSSEFDVQL